METEGQSEPAATARPKRRWFQYNISTLLLVMAVCGGVLALVVIPAMQQRRAARQQRRAMDLVESHGGYVSQTNEWLSNPLWLPPEFGVRYFQSIDMIDLSGTRISDAGLEHLKGLKALQHLNVRNTQVSDAGVAELQRALPNCAILH